MWADLSSPWQECLALSWESYCEGSIPIAAVITSPEGIILAHGRNRFGGHTSFAQQEIVGGRLAHAEINALLALDYSTVNPCQLTLFSTVEPCPLCMGAICIAGIKEVHFAARDSWAGSTNLTHASPYFRRKQISVHGPDDGKLESLIQMLQVACDVHQQHPNFPELLEVWRAERPRDVHLGEQLYQSGLLGQLRDHNAPIETVVNQIAALIND
jgi:tRNA(adenine34) deaminase